jgi:hypothetical protein
MLAAIVGNAGRITSCALDKAIRGIQQGDAG